MIDIKMYQGQGTASSGAPASTVEVQDWNMKNSGTYTVLYYPTNEGAGSAPLIRPTSPSDQVCSFPVYTFFTITGAYSAIKNLKFTLSMETPPQANNTQLFYKLTNVYSTPAAVYDGEMSYLGKPDGSLIETIWWPNFSTTGPTTATTRSPYYTNTAGTVTLYTNFFVTQVRVNNGTSIGNTAEYKLKLSCDEFEPAYY